MGVLSIFKKNLSGVDGNRGWFSWIVNEPFAGAWQKGIKYSRESVLAYHAVFSCVSLISSDISKLPIKLKQEKDGIWSDVDYGKYDVLKKPNNYQNTIQFLENWINSKLIRGNAYIFKIEDNRGNVKELHVLNPDLVTPLVSESGEVFYQLAADNLAKVNTLGITVPANRIIHDRFNCLFHPLVGLSPLFASGLPAYMGIKMSENSAKHFQNGARPSGILTVPESIEDADADKLKKQWEENYSGENAGRTAVVGGSVKYQPITMTAVENQMVEQLKMTAEMVCSTFHVPSYKVVGNAPNYNNIESLEQSYYSQCLQHLIESLEKCLDEGLEIADNLRAELDLDYLLKMDSKTKSETLSLNVKGGIFTPNEARLKLNAPGIAGGDTVWLQQQNWPIEVLAQRRNPPEEDKNNKEDLEKSLKQSQEIVDNVLVFSNKLKEMSFET